MAFTQSRKSSLGLHPPVGNTRLHVLLDFAFHALRLFASFAGIGISRSLYAFGVHPLSGLWLTRTVEAARLTSAQYVVHDFLLSHSRHQEELVPEALFLIASRK